MKPLAKAYLDTHEELYHTSLTPYRVSRLLAFKTPAARRACRRREIAMRSMGAHCTLQNMEANRRVLAECEIAEMV